MTKNTKKCKIFAPRSASLQIPLIMMIIIASPNTEEKEDELYLK